MLREFLITVAIAAACIFSSADGKEDCTATSENCPPCAYDPTLEQCASSGLRWIRKTSICGCCNQCIPTLKKGEKCSGQFRSFPKIHGGEFKVKLVCQPLHFCIFGKCT